MILLKQKGLLLIISFLLINCFNAFAIQLDPVDSLLDLLYEEAFYTDFEKAQEYLNQAESIAKSRNQIVKEAEVHIARAWMAQNFGELDLMRESIASVEKLIITNLEDIPALIKGDFFYTQASYLTRIGDNLGSIKAYRKIIDNGNKDSLLLHDTYNSIGYNYLQAGNPIRAIENYTNALSYLPLTGETPDQLISKSLDFQSIGASYLAYYDQTGDTTLLTYGIKNLRIALKIVNLKEGGYLSVVNKSAVFYNLASAFIKKDQIDSAFHVLNVSSLNHDEDDAFMYFNYKLRGDAFYKAGDYQQALGAYQKGLLVAKEKFDPEDAYTLDIFLKLAETNLSLKNFQLANEFIREGMKSIKEKEDKVTYSSFANLVLPFQTTLAKIKYEEFLLNVNEEQYRETITYFDKVIQFTREVRKSFPDRRFKEFLSLESKSLIGKAIRMSYLLYAQTGKKEYVKRAFEFSELSKSLTLLESTVAYDALHYGGIPDSVVAYGQGLKREIVAEEHKMEGGTTSNDLLNLIQQHNKHISMLEKKYPAYYELKYDTKIPDFYQLVNEMDQKEQILHYFMGENMTYLISIRSDTLQFIELDAFPGDTIEKFVNSLRTNPVGQKAENHYENFIALSKKVSDFLGVATISDKTLYLKVIPDGAVHLIPFETLTSPDGQFLLEQNAISYDLSVSLNRYHAGPNSDQDIKGPYLGFAPEYSGERAVAIRGKKDSGHAMSFQLGKLLYNEEEVKLLQKQLGGDIYTNTEASKENFISEINSYPIFHLSAHGIYNDRTPLNSAIYFTQTDNEKFYDEENALHAYEIYNNYIGAELGILSSCESGYGKDRAGEGLASLRRAFYYAGCKSIVASLWYANDRSAYKITSLFGEQLAEGKRRDVALQAAKLTFLEMDGIAFRHPYYWANLTISGKISPLAKENSTRFRWVFMVLLIVFAIGLFLFLKKSKNGPAKK